MEKHEQWGKTLYAIRELLFNEDALPDFFEHYRKDSKIYKSHTDLIDTIDYMRMALLSDMYMRNRRYEKDYDDNDHFFHIYYRQYHKRNGERNLEVTCGDCREKRIIINLDGAFDYDEVDEADE